MHFSTDYIDEPKLEFQRGNFYTPMVGLIKHGARFSTIDEKGHKWIKVGIIGSGQSMSLALKLLDEMRYPQIPNTVAKWNIPFPGLSKLSHLNFSLSYQPEWQQRISPTEISQITSKVFKRNKTKAFADIVDNKLSVLYGKSPPPDVVIVTIPKEVEESCADATKDKPLLKLPNDDDLHSRIKLYGMKYNLPTQLIRNDTLVYRKTQEKSIVFWNLAVGLLYKSQKGYPWKLTKLEENTCYVGISFFKERGKGSSKNIRASMAQVFLDTGESFILRGEPFEWNDPRYPNSPHLSKDGAKEIIDRVINQYKSVRNVLPERIVIHKSSNYWDDEKDGFLEASESINSKDFLTIQPSDLKFYRQGKYPVLRGTLISTNTNEHYLYTTGLVPCINTYPGLGVPRPLNIRCEVQSSPIQQICQEILAFTKLDWNNTFIYRKDPVTLSVSRKVGNVLAESIAKDFEQLDPHYYYYM
jgi:hypothetical protein